MYRGTRGERARIQDEGLRNRRRGRNRLGDQRARGDDDGGHDPGVLALLAVRAAFVGGDGGAPRIPAGAAGVPLGGRRRPARAGDPGVGHGRHDEREHEGREPPESGLCGHYPHSTPIRGGPYDRGHIHNSARRNLRAFRITDTELKVMAALAQIGLIRIPVTG